MARVRNHPGQLLRAELDERGITAHQLALALRVPANRITAILHGERSITADTAVRLGIYLNTDAEFWMNMQAAYEISVIQAEKGKAIRSEVLPPSQSG